MDHGAAAQRAQAAAAAELVSRTGSGIPGVTVQVLVRIYEFDCNLLSLPLGQMQHGQAVIAAWPNGPGRGPEPMACGLGFALSGSPHPAGIGRREPQALQVCESNQCLGQEATDACVLKIQLR